MSAHGETRRRAFEAACTLAAEGQRPTLQSVRERLNGRGGQKAIADGLSDWIDEAATRFAIPGVPEELRTQVVALWDLASRQADGRWAEARGALEARLAAGEAAVRAERFAVNIADYRIKDNSGWQPEGKKIDEKGPAAYFVTADPVKLAAAARRAGAPAYVSNHAGGSLRGRTWDGPRYG